MARTLPDRARCRSRSAAARAVSVTVAATAAVAVCALTAPAAAAAVPANPAVPAGLRGPDPAAGLIEVTPRQVKPGTEIEVRVDFCEVERTALATSVAFEADIDLERTADGTAFHGSATVSVTAEPGTYGVTVVCGVEAREGQSSFKVVAAGGSGHGRDRHPGRDGRHHEPPHERHASPVAPVRAGGGGTAGDRTAGSAGTAQRVGLTLAGGAAAAGAVTWVVRRRRAGTHAGG